MNSNLLKASIVVTGRVQGVWFRDYVKRSAKGLDLKGWVRNNPDGSVEAEVEGNRELIEQLIGLLKIGSPMSKVKQVTAKWFEFNESYDTFKIIR